MVPYTGIGVEEMTQVQIRIDTREIVGYGDYIPDPPDDDYIVVDLMESEENKLLLAGTKTLEEDGTISVLAPSSAPLVMRNSYHIQAEWQTSNATEVEAWNVECSLLGSLYHMSALVLAKDIGTGITFTANLSVSFKYVVPELASIVGQQNIDVSCSEASWIIWCYIVGTQLQVRVIGQEAHRINWSMNGQVTCFNPDGIV
jgi:hypothetical protein